MSHQDFQELWQKYSLWVLILLLARMLHRQDAEDLRQEVFQRVWSRFGGSNEKPENDEAYLHTVASHLCSDYIRRKCREWARIVDGITQEPADPSPGPEAQVRGNESREHMLQRLAPHVQEVVVLTEAGYNQEEIANRLGCTRRTVQRHLESAREELLEFLPLPNR